MADIHGDILAVDDNRMNRIKLARSLELQGHAVDLAEDGEQALQMVRAKTYDAVLLDIIMPGLDGYDVLRQMKGDPHLREIPVIVISSSDEIDSAVRCIELGAEDYLPKPFDAVLLRARLRASLEKKKLRDLERAYLQQEVMLRQNEKLATLGKLSAGMAHELNNPVAAVLRGTEHLSEAMDRQLDAHLDLDRSGLTDSHLALLVEIDRRARKQADSTSELDSLALNDLEAELENWLENAGVENSWELVSGLIGMAYTEDELTRYSDAFGTDRFTSLLTWAVSRYTTHSVLREICEGSGRVAEIVKALKSFTYLDQAPIQNVDVHAGLDNTLIMLRNKLKRGISVQRDYAADLPLIEARGTELNQVWTNIIDNAVQAMDGQGVIQLRTRWRDPWVVVEIEDNGPGIPESIQGQLFEPFFTTKAPGEGAGLGLNISHNIVVEKHAGAITVESRPGRTCFQVKLPLASDDR